MGYLDDEASPSDGRPIELYKFEGTYSDYFYTTAGYPVVYDGNTYAPIGGMRRSAINNGSQSDDKLEVTIDVPVATEVVIIYGFQISPPELNLTIFRTHDQVEFIQYWSGPVENISVTKGTATIRVPAALSAALLGDVPNVYFQKPCNNVLYGPVCGVDEASYSQETTISSVSGVEVQVSSIGALDGLLIGGDAVLASGERRMIVSQDGTTLNLNYPYSFAENGDAIVIAAGCDLAWDGDCLNKFDNQLRHTGFNFIPPDNVFSDGLEPGIDNITNGDCDPNVFIPVFEGWVQEFIIGWNRLGDAYPISAVTNIYTGGSITNIIAGVTSSGGGVGSGVYDSGVRETATGKENWIRFTSYREGGAETSVQLLVDPNQDIVPGSSLNDAEWYVKVRSWDGDYITILSGWVTESGFSHTSDPFTLPAFS